MPSNMKKRATGLNIVKCLNIGVNSIMEIIRHTAPESIAISIRISLHLCGKYIIFFVLQVAAAICIGLIMDRYIREGGSQNADEEADSEEENSEEDESDTDTDNDEADSTENTELDYESLLREIEEKEE